MISSPIQWQVSAFLGFLFSILVMAMPTSGWCLTGDEILRRVDRALYPISYEQYVRIQHQRFGQLDPTVTVFIARQENDHQVALLVAPESLNQRSVMRKGNQVMVQERDQSAIRYTGLPASSFGEGVLNNGDILRTDYSSGYQASLVAEDTTSYRLLLESRQPNAIVDHIALRVDKQWFVPIIEEQYGAKGALLKKIEFKGLTRYSDGLMRPSLIRATSPLSKGHVSELLIGDIQARQFTQDFNEDLLRNVNSLLR